MLYLFIINQWKNPLKIHISLVKSANDVGTWTKLPQDLKFFGLSSLVRKVNGIPLYNLSFDKNPTELYMN